MEFLQDARDCFMTFQWTIFTLYLPAASLEQIREFMFVFFFFRLFVFFSFTVDSFHPFGNGLF